MVNPQLRPVAIRARRLLRVLRDGYRYATFRYRFSDSRGVFATFAEARAAAPANKPIGYDDTALAHEYADGLQVELSDYDFPALFHLTKIIASTDRPLTILDFGGNVGTHFLRFRKYLDLRKVRWVVCEVPEIAKIGREICKAHEGVRFVSDLSEVPDADVVLAIGSVQYFDDFAALIRQSRIAPSHVLIGQVLLHQGRQFVTLQNGGRVYYPQYIFNRQDFIESFTATGFVVADSWADTANGCYLPFHPDLKIESRGFCFATE